MKKSLMIAAFALLASAGAKAQWEKPTDVPAQQERKAGLFDKNKGVVAIEPKYDTGAVTEKDGKVCWTLDVEVPGKKADEVYSKAMEVLKKFVKTEKHTPISQIAVVNPQERKIGVRAQEMLVFANKALVLDQTKFNYHLIVTCADGHCFINLSNISYRYEEDREGGLVTTAEEMIADGVAFNKKHTRFAKGGTKKFRTKTIDRKDEIFEYLKAEIESK